MKSFIAGALLFLAGLFGTHASPPTAVRTLHSPTNQFAAVALALNSTASALATSRLAYAAAPSGQSDPAPTLTTPSPIPSSTSDFVTQDELAAELNNLRALVYSIAGTTTAFTNPQIAANGNGVYYGSVSAPVTQISASLITGLAASEIPALNYFPATSTIDIAYGGTGTSTRPTANELMLSDALGKWEYVATSSLGLGGSSQWTTNSSNIYYSTGNVGVGTTSPFAYFSIAGAAGGTQNLFAISTSTSGFATSTALRISQNGNLHFLNGAGIDIGNGVTPPSNGLIVLGNVGVGTTSPTHKLSIWGSSTNGFFAISSTTSGDIFNVTSSGNVAIGTTLSSAAPSSSLGVRGNIYGGGTFLTGLQQLTTQNFISNGSLKSGIPTFIIGPINTITGMTFCGGPGLVRLQNGLLYLTYSCGSADASFDHIMYYQTSTDNGATWSAQQTLSPSPGTDPHDTELTLLKSGKVILSYMIEQSGLPTQTYVMIGDPTPTGITWGNPISVSTGSLFNSGGTSTTGKVVELQNGTLMLPVYGTLSSGGGNATVVVFSTDGGSTWGGKVTVAASTSAAGYNEANALQLASGRIVMILRDNTAAPGYDYLYSDDNGQTWSSPTNIIADSDPGRPSVVLLGSGGIFFMGRTAAGTIVSASWDGGVTWATPTLPGGGETYDALVLQSGGDIAAVTAQTTKLIYREFADGYGLFGNGVNILKNTTVDTQNGSFKLSFDTNRFMTITHGALAANAATTQNNDLTLSMLGGSTSHGAVIFSTGASSLTEKMRITQAGNVGIGTSSPSSKLAVSGGASVGADYNFAAPTNGLIVEGNVALGTTTPYARLSVWGSDAASSTLAFNVVNSASTTVLAVFDGGNAQLSGTLTQSSDQRLKTNIQSLDASSSLSLIDQLNPVTFNWINPDQGSTPQLGFIAQQVQQVFPSLISTTSATSLTPDGTLGLNYIGLIAPIVKAVQAIYADVLALEQTVAGFANSFTSHKVTTDKLCLSDANGTSCYTRSQLDVALASVGQAGNQSPSAAEQSQSATTSTPDLVTQNPDATATSTPTAFASSTNTADATSTPDAPSLVPADDASSTTMATSTAQ